MLPWETEAKRCQLENTMMFLFDDTCKVVNRSKDRYDVYIGRPSIFQNPYVIGSDGTREEVIEKFKYYFIDKIKNDKDFKFKVDRLKGKKFLAVTANQKIVMVI